MAANLSVLQSHVKIVEKSHKNAENGANSAHLSGLIGQLHNVENRVAELIPVKKLESMGETFITEYNPKGHHFKILDKPIEPMKGRPVQKTPEVKP